MANRWVTVLHCFFRDLLRLTPFQSINSIDPIEFNEIVYVATTDGTVNTFDLDGTPGNVFDAGASVDLPLLGNANRLYVTPSSSKVYAVDATTLDTIWTVNLSSANTGPAFMIYLAGSASTNELYVAAADTVYKITDNGASGTITWKAAASDTVKSGPINWGDNAYFGSKDGTYHAVNDADGSSLAQWPYPAASGEASSGPWIRYESDADSLVIFGGADGNLDAFSLE